MSQSLITLPDSGRQAVSQPEHDLLQLDDILSLLNFLRRHQLRLVIGVVTAIALAAIYHAKCPRIYESNAKLLVAKKDPLSVQGMPSAVIGGADSMSTHIALIKSPWLADRVLSDEKITGLETFASEEQPVALLIKSLDVLHEDSKALPYSQSTILEFSFQGIQQQECKDVLDAVIDAYRQYLNESCRTANQDASTLLTQKADQLRQSFESKERAYEQFRQSAPRTLTSDSNNDFFQRRLASLESSRAELGIRLAEVSSLLEAWRKETLNGEISSAAQAMLPDSLKPKWNQKLEALVISLLADDSVTGNALGLGPNHPKVKAQREKIEALRQLFLPSDPKSEGFPHADDSVAKLNATDAVAEYTIQLEQQLKGLQAADELLQTKFNRVQQEMELAMKEERERKQDAERALAEFKLKSEQFSNAIARDHRLYDALMDQLQRVEIDIVSGSYTTTLIAPPSYARLVSPRTLIIFSLAVFLGMACGLTWAFAAEIANRQTSIAQAGVFSFAVPVLGQIPAATSKGALVQRKVAQLTQDPALSTHRAPDSSIAEAYRCLRTTLYMQAERQPLKTIVITSPNVGDGTSTLAANLAVSIAQSGRQVLLIDANLHGPRVNEVFGVSNNLGLASVLAGECALKDAVTECGVEGLFILPSGPRPASRPADLLSAPCVKELFHALREKFDYILVDTPAMLAVADAQILATNSDGVLLTVRNEHKGGPAVARAGEMLEQTGANVLGVVLNGVGTLELPELGDYAHMKNGNGTAADSRLSPALGSAGSSVPTGAV